MKKQLFLCLCFILSSIIITQDIEVAICNEINCPSNRGKCYNDDCLCFAQFASLNTGTDKSCSLFCQYDRISRWVPILLEIFLPGLGNYSYGKKFLSMTKAGIILIPFVLLAFGAVFKSIFLRSTFHEMLHYIMVSAIIIFVIMEVCDILFYGLGWYVDQNGIPFL